MENLNTIRQELLESHAKISNILALRSDDSKTFYMDGLWFYVSDCTLGAKSYKEDFAGLEVSTFANCKKITIDGNVEQALKIAKPLKQWRKITKYITDKNI